MIEPMSPEKRNTTARTSDLVNRPTPEIRHGHQGWQTSPNAPQRKPNRRPVQRGKHPAVWILTLLGIFAVGIGLSALHIPALASAHNIASAQIDKIGSGISSMFGAQISHPVHSTVAGSNAVPSTPIQVANTDNLPAGSVAIVNPNLPLTIQSFSTKYCPFRLVMGGVPGSKRSPLRQGVEDFVKQAGAAAGLNGTFFANASLEGTDNLLIGPSMCGGETSLLNSPFDARPALTGRPMVLISPKQTDLIPYQYGVESDDKQLHGFLPNVTDAFLGGVWLVHNSVAANISDVESFNMKDAQDPRRRAFFAIMADGRPALGATTYVATSSQLAAGLQSVGVREAVLLDSGFSTSLVFQDKILVTGHTAVGIPSRPVPQALLLFGTPDPSAIATAQSMPTSIAKSLPQTPTLVTIHRHHRHRIVPALLIAPGAAPTLSAPDTQTPAAPPPTPGDSPS